MTVSFSRTAVLEVVQTILLLVIIGLVAWMQPWSGSASGDAARKITVVGEATVKAEPDEYVFSPYFQRTGTDKLALQDELNKLATDAVAGLKNIGVQENQIKLDASSYDNWYYNENEEGVLSVSLTIALPDDSLVQQVQDYLLGLGAEGQVSPQASFSDAKRTELEEQARVKASEDARKKADTQAAQFDTKVGKLLSVDSTNGGGFGYPIAYDVSTSLEAGASRSSLPVLSGEQEITLQVTAVYELQ